MLVPISTICRKAAEDGLNACVVHPSGIMGPEDYAMGETTKTLIEIINGKMHAGINGSFNLCDVRDLADGVAEVRRFDLEPPQL